MARRRKQGLAEDLMDVIALLPWWVGVLLAVASYVALHAFALSPAPAPPSGAATDAHMSHMIARMWRSLASGGQYLVPLICLVGAVASALGQRRRQGLLRAAAQPKGAAVIHNMSWQDFELLVGEAFRRRGFRVTEYGGGGSDGGVDLVLEKDQERYLIQCKQWRAYKVGVPVVRELYGVMAAEGATGGYVVTSGVFTDEARQFASGRNIELISGAELPALLGVSASTGGVATQTAAPLCPRCRHPMTPRVARRGTSAGKPFWGCSRYPRCWGVVTMAGG